MKDSPSAHPEETTSAPAEPPGEQPPLAGEQPPETQVAPSPGPPLEPIASFERHDSLDVLRGVAVLGILAMNIYFYGLPAAAYTNPSVYGGSTGANLATWVATHLFFELKFMTIFSALFGAGLVVMFQRAEARQRSLLETLPLRGGQPRATTLVPLGLPDPAPQRLGGTAYLLRDRSDGRPLRVVLALVVEDHPHRSLSNLW